MRHSRMFGLIFLVGAALLLPEGNILLEAAPANPPGQRASTIPPPPLATEQLNLSWSKDLLGVVLDFRQGGLTDLPGAVSQYGLPQAVRQFDHFNKVLFEFTDHTNSWSYFFNTAIFVLGRPGPSNQVAAFYHPWSDVFLLMDWTRKNGRWSLADAEIVVGDWIRDGGPASLNAGPLWTRKNLFGPLALGITVAQTVAAFEKIFLGRAGQGFREILPSMKNEKAVRDPNYAYAASRLLSVMMKIEVLGGELDKDRLLASLWTETYQAVDRAAEGAWEEIFKTADKTLPTTRFFLKKLAPETFQDLVIVDYYIQEGGWLVFLASVFDSGYCYSLSFEPDSQKRMILKRIDFISFATFYDNYKKGAKPL